MKLTYRPEIDGLRAIAIVAVIFYHAQITILGHQFFKGGFIGVDIFFVISGYLITSIILKELFSKGSFSFKNFYERRIRRILPNLLAVMFVSSIFAGIFLLPEILIDFTKSIIYSLGFSSNFYFHYSDQSYFFQGIRKPFLHSWSLSVEEQFYILFPIILLITCKYFKKYLIHILILGFFISLGLADWGSRNHPSFNFYVLPTRGWELLAGSILAYFEINNGHRNKNRILNIILPFIGLILIGYSILFFNEKIRHPSFYTLLPITGTCLIIWYSNKNEIVTKMLSTKLFVGTGLISYSLYLWHYPILSFNEIINFFDDGILKNIILLFIIIISSIFSYFFVEKKFRDKNFSLKKIFSIIVISYIVLIFLSINVIIKEGFKDKYNSIYKKNNFFNYELSNNKHQFLKDNYYEQKFKSDRLKILVVGDSHSIDLFFAFITNQDLFNKYEFQRYGYDGNNDSINFNRHTTIKTFQKFEDSDLFEQADIILISDFIKKDEDLQKLEEFIIYFKEKKKIILTTVSNIYKHKLRYGTFNNLNLFDYYFLDTRKTKENIDKNITLQDINSIDNFYFENRKFNPINDKIKLLSQKYGVKLLEKEDYQCDSLRKICYGITNDGFKIYTDGTHYSLEGSEFFGKKIYNINWLRLD